MATRLFITPMYVDKFNKRRMNVTEASQGGGGGPATDGSQWSRLTTMTAGPRVKAATTSEDPYHVTSAALVEPSSEMKPEVGPEKDNNIGSESANSYSSSQDAIANSGTCQL